MDDKAVANKTIEVRAEIVWKNNRSALYQHRGDILPGEGEIVSAGKIPRYNFHCWTVSI